MEVIGIDLGGYESKVCRWVTASESNQSSGPEIVTNDLSKRTSPSKLCFRKSFYSICDQRQMNVIKNYDSYIWGYKTVLGSKDGYAPSMSERVKNDKDRAVYPVSYNQKDYKIDAEVAQSLVLEYLYYTFLKTNSVDYDSFPFKLPELLETPREVVITIPQYYTLSNIRGLEAALAMANLGPVSFIREGVAVALEYGYYNAAMKKFPEKGFTVLFCDMGMCSTTLTIVQFFNDKMIVIGSEYMMMGGQDFDRAIAEVLLEKCEDQVGGKIETNALEKRRLQMVAEKIKKDLSTGLPEAEYCFTFGRGMDEMDGLFTREEFGTACKKHNLLDTFYNFVFDSLRKQSAAFSLDAVEMVGCSTYIPQVGEQLLQAVQQASFDIMKISCTMNRSEACARGAALFAQLALQERKIKCEARQVSLEGVTSGDKFYGCGVKIDSNGYAISTSDSLKEGADHDWKAIMQNGAAFLKEFVEVSRELNDRQQAHQQVEGLWSELSSYLTMDQDDSHRSEREKDNAYLEKVEVMVHSSENLESVQEYSDVASELKKRILKWERLLNVQNDRREINGLVYTGFWLEDVMTGVFECYDLSGVHLFTAKYKDGVKDGPQTSYYPQGEVKSVCCFANGELEGKYTGFFENGQKSRYCVFANGVREGYYQEFFPNGQLRQEGLVKDKKNVFINLFFRNGSIYRQYLFDTAGVMRKAYEWNRAGHLVYEGNMPNEKYHGRSVLFYRNLYYANCRFRNGELISRNGEVVPAAAYSVEQLDAELKKYGDLDKRKINWKKIATHEETARGFHGRWWSYNDVDQDEMTNEFTVEEDVFREGKTGAESGEKELSALEKVQKMMRSANFKEMTIKYFNLFGDLRCMTEKDGSDLDVVRTEFYPCGIKETESTNPKSRRVKLVRKYEAGYGDDVECEATLYWNNGVVKRKGIMKGKTWVSSEEYLNTGKKIVS